MYLGHGSLVFFEDAGPAEHGLLGLDLFDTPQEHEQPGDDDQGDGLVQGYLHGRDGQHVGEDDQIDDKVVVVPKVPVPVINGAGRTTRLQTIPTKDIQERRKDKEEDQEPGTDKEDQAVASASWVCSQA